VNENDSLDPVASWESLGRLCSADMWDGDKLHPSALLRDDLMMPTRGWSVQRVECTSLALAAERATGLKPVATTVAVANAGAIRAIQARTGGQGLFVIENYVLGNPAHALVFARPGLKNGPVRQLRERLIEILVRKERLEQVFRS
jgi:hypothetical protein